MIKNKYLISVPKEHLKPIDVVKKACDKHNIVFSSIAVKGILSEFENGGWAELIKRKEK